MPQVFISYRRGPSSILAQLLRQELKAKGIDAFVDVRDIESSGPFPEKLTRAIESAGTLVCLLADTTLESEWVQQEIQQAYTLGKTLIPVFQESYSAIEAEYPDYITALLSNQGVQVFDARGVFVAEAITQLVALLKNSRPESIGFSTEIKSQMTLMNKTFEALTNEQFQIINMLRYQKRVAIAGCAGSGKTLIAAEKAIRLDHAGARTIMLCHSTYLASYIQQLVRGTGVVVSDFTSWINQILGRTVQSSDDWNHFEEPSTEDLAEAFDKLVDSANRYDAVIVDEGQDFRSDWWIVIEAALISQESGVLYIFHDDHQTLLYGRSKYPIVQAPIVLSKNCRNSGEVFDLVRHFHPQLPETSIALKNQGIVRQWVFTSGSEYEAVDSAIAEALDVLPTDQLVVLTTEPEPIEQSMLEGLELELHPKWHWQEVVLKFLGNVTLSDAPFPTDEDIRTVKNFAKSIAPLNSEYDGQLKMVKWRAAKDQIVLNHPFGDHFKRARRFFQSDEWAEGIPRARKIRISSRDFNDEDTIRLSTVSSFKGLESEGVILFVPTSSLDHLDANIYVGISRARFLLHLAIDSTIARKSHIGQLGTVRRSER